MRTITLAAPAVCAALGGAMAAAQAQQPCSPAAVFLTDQPQLEAKAVDLLQRMGATLAAARTLSFTSVATYESPARGQPLAMVVQPAQAWMRAGRFGEASGGGGSWNAQGWLARRHRQRFPVRLEVADAGLWRQRIVLQGHPAAFSGDCGTAGEWARSCVTGFLARPAR